MVLPPGLRTVADTPSSGAQWEQTTPV